MEFENFKETYKNEDFKEIERHEMCFEKCKFINCSFLGADLSEISFIDCVFNNSDFSMSKISNKTKIQNCFFIESRIAGINFSLLNDFMTSFDFDRCLLKHCNFSNLKLKKTNFIECLIEGCDFMQTDLNSSSFRKSKFSETLFEGADLRKANFLGSIGFEINPINNKLYGAKFNKSEVFGLLKIFGIKFEN